MTTNNDYQGPLTGLNVIDFGHYYAGPMVGMLLADQGANVIRIVKPGEPEPLLRQQYRLLNRNKKLLELDLKTGEGKVQALALIERADVVIENFRPGVMKRLGLDYASVKHSNSGLVYLSLPGFSSTDKERAHIQAWEGILGAASGLFADTSTVRPLLGYPPVYSWVPLCSTYGATHGAVAVMAALHAREEHGVGTVIEIPLVEAGISAFGGSFLYAWRPDGFAPFRNVDAEGIQHAHEEWVGSDPDQYRYRREDSPKVQEEKLSQAFQEFFSLPTGRAYRCADNRKVWLWTASPSKYGIALYKGLGIYSQLLEDGFVTGTSCQGNSLNAPSTLSPEWRQRLIMRLEDIFMTKPAEEWENLLGEKTLIAVIRTKDEWLAMEPMLESGVLVKMQKGSSTLTVPGQFASVSGPDGEAYTQYREALPIDSEDLASLLAPTSSRQNLSQHRSLKKGDLLKHLKVLDLSNVVAGPTASYTLAQYGAEVIKLDSPQMMLGVLAPIMTLEIGQGKRSMLVDMRTEPGREVFRKLVLWADVVLHNFLDDVAERLGVNQGQLRAINPNVVGCQISCFGGARRGGWELHPGLDTIPQAAAGLMAHFGSLEDPQIHGRTACGDNMGAIGLAFAALLASWQRRKTGFAGEGRTSMAQAVNVVQLPYMIAENGSSDWGESHGQQALGDYWYRRLYQARNGWIFVAAREKDAPTLSKTVAGDKDADEMMLADSFAIQDVEHWVEKLNAAGIPCHRVMSITDIVDQGVRSVGNAEADETSSTTGEVFRWENHPCGHPILIKAPDWVLVGEDRSFKRLTPTPRFGEHTREIMKELGFSAKDIDRLISLEVVHEYPPVMRSKEAYLTPE